MESHTIRFQTLGIQRINRCFREGHAAIVGCTGQAGIAAYVAVVRTPVDAERTGRNSATGRRLGHFEQPECFFLRRKAIDIVFAVNVAVVEIVLIHGTGIGFAESRRIIHDINAEGARDAVAVEVGHRVGEAEAEQVVEIVLGAICAGIRMVNLADELEFERTRLAIGDREREDERAFGIAAFECTAPTL